MSLNKNKGKLQNAKKKTLIEAINILKDANQSCYNK